MQKVFPVLSIQVSKKHAFFEKFSQRSTDMRWKFVETQHSARLQYLRETFHRRRTHMCLKIVRSETKFGSRSGPGLPTCVYIRSGRFLHDDIGCVWENCRSWFQYWTHKFPRNMRFLRIFSQRGTEMRWKLLRCQHSARLQYLREIFHRRRTHMRSNLSEVRQNSGPEVDLGYRHAFLEKFPDHIDTEIG